MKGFAVASALAALTVVSATPTKSTEQPPSKRSNLPAISASGNAFYTNGDRFYIRGIDYQPGGSSGTIDPLANEAGCERDIALFKDLGVNTVRVYAVDNSENHDYCMGLLQDAGIYLVLDVNNPRYSLNRIAPFESYNAAYLQSVFATVEAFAKYSNTMAFFSGNEVINNQLDTEVSAPFIKAVTRDMKNYINARGLRAIPVGYSAADVSQNRWQTAEYMNCGPDDARADFFAFNDYSFCNTNFEVSGWAEKVQNLTNYGLPIFLSEYGCIKNGARKFDELDSLMSTNMTGVYSGGIMYQYSVEGDGYGIVKIDGNSTDPQQPEYDNFKSALAEFPAPTTVGAVATTTHAATCPATNSAWVIGNDEIPTMPEQAQKYMSQGAGTGPGLNGPGSQTDAASGTSTSNTTSGVPSPTGTSSSSSGGDTSGAFSLNGGSLLLTAVPLFAALFGAALL